MSKYPLLCYLGPSGDNSVTQQASVTRRIRNFTLFTFRKQIKA